MKVTSARFIGGANRLERLPVTGLAEIAFAGRSNVGKSRLINCLAGRRRLALTSSTPGKTRHLNFYLINSSFYFVDLPGYGYAKVSEEARRGWGRLIEAYVTNRAELAGVVVITDARHDLSPLDVQVITWLRELEIPVLVVATKADKLSANKLMAQRARNERLLKGLGIDGLVLFSAVTKLSRPELWKAISDLVKGSRGAPSPR